MPIPSIVMLCDLDEPFHPDVATDRGAWIYETVQALSASARSVGGMEIHVVVQRGASVDVPAITVDPAELGTAGTDAFRRARQEAVYVQLALRGMLQPYALVHVLAPVVGVAQVVAASGRPVVQTIVAGLDHPSSVLPPRLLGTLLRRAVPDSGLGETASDASLGEGLLPEDVERRRSAADSDGPTNLEEYEQPVPIPVDLGRFRIDSRLRTSSDLPGSKARRRRGYVLSVGQEVAAPRIAEALGLSLRVLDGASGASPVETTDVAALVAGAKLLFYARESSPASLTWPLRALACGVPVAGWMGGPLDVFRNRPDLAAVAPPGDVERLVRRVEATSFRSEDADERRAFVMAHHGPRAVAARYRSLYASLLEPDAPATAAAGLEARDEPVV